MDFFDLAYRGTPPWDIGRPRKEFTELVLTGEITGSVLDIGCGSGEPAVFFTQEWYDVRGIDSAPWRSRRHGRRLHDKASYAG
jgi:SAM-dependent methyltransferase